MPKAEDGEFGFAASGTCVVTAGVKRRLDRLGRRRRARSSTRPTTARPGRSRRPPSRRTPTAAACSRWRSATPGRHRGRRRLPEADNGADASRTPATAARTWTRGGNLGGYRSGVSWVPAPPDGGRGRPQRQRPDPRRRRAPGTGSATPASTPCSAPGTEPAGRPGRPAGWPCWSADAGLPNGTASGHAGLMMEMRYVDGDGVRIRDRHEPIGGPDGGFYWVDIPEWSAEAEALLRGLGCHEMVLEALPAAQLRADRARATTTTSSSPPSRRCSATPGTCTCSSSTRSSGTTSWSPCTAR